MDKQELEGRISRLEREHSTRPDPVDVKKFKEQEEARQDDLAVKDMITLGGDDYAAKKKVYEAHRDAQLSPEQAKKKHQESVEDDKWTDHMLERGGQNANR